MVEIVENSRTLELEGIRENWSLPSQLGWYRCYIGNPGTLGKDEGVDKLVTSKDDSKILRNLLKLLVLPFTIQE